MHFKPHVGLALALLAVGGMTADRPVHAQFFQNSTGLSSPARTITFDEVVLSRSALVTNQYSFLGVTFSGVTYDPDITNFNANITGHRIGNFIPNVGGFNPFSIHFNAPQTQAAFALSTPTGPSEIDAYLNGNKISTQFVTTNQASNNNFFGFQGLLLDEIRITSNNTFDRTAIVDNLQFGAPVPEASSVVSLGLLLLLGLGGVAISRRRKAGAAR